MIKKSEFLRKKYFSESFFFLIFGYNFLSEKITQFFFDFFGKNRRNKKYFNKKPKRDIFYHFIFKKILIEIISYKFFVKILREINQI